MQCVATAAFSLEGVVKRELIRLGIDNARGEMGAVRFEASEEKLFEANLWLRCADRVGGYFASQRGFSGERKMRPQHAHECARLPVDYQESHC